MTYQIIFLGYQRRAPQPGCLDPNRRVQEREPAARATLRWNEVP
jgi:hypothetical protein